MALTKRYRIGKVAEKLELRTSVLRFWESEFSELVPRRSAKGHRYYTDEDVELLKRIKQLLHEQGMTIEGARRVLGSGEGGLSPADSVAAPAYDSGFLVDICRELSEVRELLRNGSDK